MSVTIKKRDRSPNFPFITLEQAIIRANEFYKNEKRGAAPAPVAVTHWGYSEKSSGGIQTIAALKSYGLMEDEGKGISRRVRISELALRILLDARENPKDRTVCLQTAALFPPVFKEIHERWPEDAPSPSALNHHLIFDMGFSPEGAKDAARIYLKNSELALLYTYNLSPTVENDNEPIESNTPAEVHAAGGVTRQITQVNAGKIERIIGPTGDIVLQFIGEPSLEAYEFLEGYIKLRKGVLAGAKSKTTDSDSDAAK